MDDDAPLIGNGVRSCSREEELVTLDGSGEHSHSSGSSVENEGEHVSKLRRKVQYHFMTPCEKFKARKRIPWKLILQLVKILLVTLQVMALGASRFAFVTFTQSTSLAFKHMLFENWDVAFETLPYPPAVGKYALYTEPALISHLNHFMTQLNQTEKLAIGVIDFPSNQDKKVSRSARFCMTSFKIGEIYPRNATYQLDAQLVEDCMEFKAHKSDNGTEYYDIIETLEKNKHKLIVNKMHKLVINFTMYAIHIREHMVIEPFDAPTCLKIDTTVIYDNTFHDGQVLIYLDMDVTSIGCREDSKYTQSSDISDGITQYVLKLAYDSSVIIICLFSTLTCIRSLMKGWKLRREVIQYFRENRGVELPSPEKRKFINLWFYLTILSDILTICGSSVKIAISHKNVHLYDCASILLGTATILVWLGVLRYLEWFHKFNVLMLTMRKALPHVLRFMCCALIFYIAFTLCGWLVLGPYHQKFATIWSTSECLFSLVNGDDMFVTFSIITDKMPTSIWIYSRIYLYFFISLFIYFVLNVFISVIIDTYETIKKFFEKGFPETKIDLFIQERLEATSSTAFLQDIRTDQTSCLSSLHSRLFTKMKPTQNRQSTGISVRA